MVDLYVDKEFEFYIRWSAYDYSFVLENLETGSRRKLELGELDELKPLTCHYSVSEDNVEQVLDGARRALVPLPDYYREAFKGDRE
jgi:hypothetical protein